MSNNSGGSNYEEAGNDFGGVTQPKESRRSNRPLKDKAQNLVTAWLEINSKDLLTDAACLEERVLMDLFIMSNTAIPFNAASGAFVLYRQGRTSVRNNCFPRVFFQLFSMDKDIS